MTTTEPRRAARPGRRLLLGGLAALTVVAAVAWSLTTWARDEDRRVDPTTPAARAAIAVAQDVVPGRLVEATYDIDDDKWEIIIVQRGREYEVELDPNDLSLLRLDYD
ncbi:MAG: hypothetical protein ACRDPC_26675 [Solirubrobacteraceae bacterium]